MDPYPTTYSDARGSESTIIVNDGQELTVHLRGVRFVGHDFDSLEPKDATTEQLTQFNLCKGDLCSCRIQCRMPIPVQTPDKVHDGVMFSDLVLGDPAPNGGIDEERLFLTSTRCERPRRGCRSGENRGLGSDRLAACDRLPSGAESLRSSRGRGRGSRRCCSNNRR